MNTPPLLVGLAQFVYIYIQLEIPDFLEVRVYYLYLTIPSDWFSTRLRGRHH
jgi:hypothetical protein